MKLISFPSWFTGTSSVQWEYLYAYCPVLTVATGHFRKQASIALQAGTPLDLGYAYFHLIIRLTTWALYLHILCTHTPLNNAPGNVSNLSPPLASHASTNNGLSFSSPQWTSNTNRFYSNVFSMPPVSG